jgi:hypothetical protein
MKVDVDVLTSVGQNWFVTWVLPNSQRSVFSLYVTEFALFLCFHCCCMAALLHIIRHGKPRTLLLEWLRMSRSIQRNAVSTRGK